MSTDLEKNKRIVRRFFAAWNERTFDEFDDLMAADAVLSVGGGTVPCHPAATRAIAEAWTAAFADWRFELLHLIAEADLVAAHVPYRGTFTAPLFGVEPTGAFARVDEMVVFRIANGKIAEAWEVYDEAGMWRQLRTRPPG